MRKSTKEAINKMDSDLENFIINAMLIDPINDIINKLENREYRSCDIGLLNDRLQKFSKLALETLGQEMPEITLFEEDNNLNDYKVKEYLNHYRTLLKYFKSF